MRAPSIPLTPEGWPLIGLTVVVTVVFALLGWGLLAVLGLVGLVLTVNFFRDPERFVPCEPGLAVAPADGRVVKVGPAKDPLTGQERQVVCIFMNIFDVHVNRAPVAGLVTALRYWPGKFINASLDKASEDNERLAMQLTDEGGATWTVVQIAGLLARRIVPWAEMGDSLARGQRYGMIRFGSRLDVYLPNDYHSNVTIGQRVTAGQTVIAVRQPE
jgi:phosphatidylserine decarboxylase